jgi:hypothetical protein
VTVPEDEGYWQTLASMLAINGTPTARARRAKNIRDDDIGWAREEGIGAMDRYGHGIAGGRQVNDRHGHVDPFGERGGQDVKTLPVPRAPAYALEPLCATCGKPILRLYPERTEDLQHERFGSMCLECRGPERGEGHFMRTVVDEVLAAALPDNFPDAVRRLIMEHKPRQRILPKWQLPWTSSPNRPPGRFESRTHMPDNKAIMNILGVEDNNNLFGAGIVVDIRWFKSIHCICTDNPCTCVCYRRQLMNICKVLKQDHTTFTRFAVSWEHARHPSNENERVLALMYNEFHDAGLHPCNDSGARVPVQPCGSCGECAPRGRDNAGKLVRGRVADDQDEPQAGHKILKI